MTARLLIAKLMVFLAAHPAVHLHRQHERHRLGPTLVVEATSYSPCSSGSRMADGHHTYFGAVASNRHPLGTLLRMRRLVLGRRYYRVRDTGSAAMQLDFWQASCRAAVVFGRRRLAYQVVVR